MFGWEGRKTLRAVYDMIIIIIDEIIRVIIHFWEILSLASQILDETNFKQTKEIVTIYPKLIR